LIFVPRRIFRRANSPCAIEGWLGVQALRRGRRSCGRRSVKNRVSLHWIRSSSYFWFRYVLSLSLFPFTYLCPSQNFFAVDLQQDIFPGRYCMRNFPGSLRAQAMSLLNINCYCCLLLLASFHPYREFFF
jgi:hypothetical protein